MQAEMNVSQSLELALNRQGHGTNSSDALVSAQRS